MEYLVYNNLDQVVATQDAIQRASNEWLVTKYDGLGRTVLSGIWSSSTATTRDAVKALANDQAAPNLWEERTTTGLGYTSRAWPATGITTTLLVNYYDGYTAPSSGSRSYKNTESGYSYNLDQGVSGKTGLQVEKPHVDVNYPNPKPVNVPPKKKLDIE